VVWGVRLRLRLLLLVTVAAVAVDQSGKLAAAAVHPAGYVQNPSLRYSVWVGLALALVGCLLPYRPLVVAVGLSLGGGLGNLLDHYAWPGGTPDFISISWLFRGAVWNLGDLLIVIGTLGVGLALLVWPVDAGLRQSRQGTSRLSS
jgi:lipoprotein signal peptidase